jgi:hypothetical protein
MSYVVVASVWRLHGFPFCGMQPPMGLDAGFAGLGLCGVVAGAWAGLGGKGGHGFPFVGTQVLRPFFKVTFALAHWVQSAEFFPQIGFAGAGAKALFDQTDLADKVLSCLFL